MRGPLVRLLRHRDLVLAAAFSLFGMAELASRSRYEGIAVWPGPAPLAAAGVLLVTLPLAVRRTHATAVCLTVLSVVAGYSLLVGPLESTAVFLAVLVSTFGAVAYGTRPWWAAGAALAAMGVHNAVDPTVRGASGWFWSAGFIAVGLLLGVAVRTRQIRIVSLEEDVDRSAREHERRVAEATAAERAAIARELHDIVAHHVSVIVIQAQAGSRALEDDLDTAARLLGTIESTGRSALDDLRRLLRLLSAEGASTRPAPGLALLDDLVGRFRDTGLVVRLERPDPTPALSGSADLAAYRMVQEALTNAVRHAPGAAVDVRLEQVGGSGGPGLAILIEDDGGRGSDPQNSPVSPAPVPAGAGLGAGRGLIGMRERLDLAGGTLIESARTEAGYRVQAWLPVEPQLAVDLR